MSGKAPRGDTAPGMARSGPAALDRTRTLNVHRGHAHDSALDPGDRPRAAGPAHVAGPARRLAADVRRGARPARSQPWSCSDAWSSGRGGRANRGPARPASSCSAVGPVHAGHGRGCSRGLAGLDASLSCASRLAHSVRRTGQGRGQRRRHRRLEPPMGCRSRSGYRRAESSPGSSARRSPTVGSASTSWPRMGSTSSECIRDWRSTKGVRIS